MKKRNLIVTSVIVGSLLIGSTAVFASTSDQVISFLERFTGITEQRVEKGDLTQAQADEITSWLESAPEGVDQLFRGDRMQDGHRNGKGGGAIDQYAELKGIDAEEVVATLKESDLNIFELADQDGLFDELKTIMLTDCEKVLTSAVKADKLTQEQADTKLAEMTETFASWTDSSTMPQDFGMGMKTKNGERPDGATGDKGHERKSSTTSEE
jgi:hypothetical protein